ncbi:hypothetical protein DUT90_02630 [Polaribacter sp. WD7]|uniref:Ig-like domain-containing protein n=1 Tax=Polaribacter sp. WD7 TaxID=2269061 RepID=UPI000DF2CCDC|nr:Ig-like domain-containing protein [Polaribacter sp. WD7]RCS27755.1 hypothetical protein DUT90_02630 [Polaribacter sp. WD7]
MNTFFRFFYISLTIIILTSCARTGRPEGGPRDETPPLFVIANPPYETIEFKGKEIKLTFNEFIKLKDINKQLIVSPPLKNPLLITPQGAATKKLSLKILDTLRENTTYIINFGNAVEDNNEGNTLEAFKYVFSTGSYIDSLTTTGTVKDAFTTEDLKSTNVLLYKIDTAYTDSIIYKKKPNYVTNTLDTTNFIFTNLRKGKYLMVALKEKSSDYIFDPKTDKIGFYSDTITLPKDSIIDKPIMVFKEISQYKFKRAKEVSKGKIVFGYEGEPKNFSVKLTSNTPNNFKSISKFETKTDTLNYWFTPFEADSLNFIISNDNFLDTVTVKLRKKKIDSLLLQSTISRTLNFRDTLFIMSNNPMVEVDTTKITLITKDSIPVPYKKIDSDKENKTAFIFKKKPEQTYKMTILPAAFTDIYAQQNDTLQLGFNTKEIEDYGRITFTINNKTNKNLIIDLLSGKNKEELIERNIVTKSSKNLVFDMLEPKTYFVRAIIDTNKNGRWDTGNFLEKKQPETIIYFEGKLELRANYYLDGNVFTVNLSE